MRELELLSYIERVAASQPRDFPRVVVPPGDDCAAVRTPSGDLLLAKVDQVVGGRHFTPPVTWDRDEPGPDGLTRDAYLGLIARKSVARALSDIGAMAGRPMFGLAAACLPAGFPSDAAEALAEALHRWGSAWSCPIVGGDIASAGRADPGPLVIGLTVIGLAHASRGPVLRSEARPGDEVYVTGSLGGSLEASGLGRHLTFEPRVPEGAALADALGARLHAMMDISDGLGLDAGRMGRASGLVVELDGVRVPVTPGSDLRGALRDGEDYELLFAVEAGAAPPELACGVTKIGVCRVPDGSTPGARVRHADGTTTEVSRLGWEHT
ncbi:MAG: thiamine-phosphate kinase [Planctomycetota bacterium]|nr:thiamine-phosphate kinase [Planctomycetota bacterium]